MRGVLPRAVGLALLAAAPAAGQLPVTGRPVPALATFDDAMQAFMDNHGLDAGVLGVMRNGRVVYLRGFGEDFDGSALPENALFRLASCSKPITAAVVRQLVARGDFALGDQVFTVGSSTGLLGYTPFPRFGDARFDDITVDHLLRHRGGWDRSDDTGIGEDVTYMERDVADDLDVASPPGRVNTVRWILGQPLQFAPGSRAEYSNVGMLVLGLLAEQASGQPLVDYVRRNVLTPAMWVPATEVVRGRTFRDQQDPREPGYRSGGAASVFDSRPGLVAEAYGGWDHEARIGQGGYVLSAAAVLEFLERYHVGTFDADIGQPIGPAFPRDEEGHNGALAGVNTYVRQRSDGVNVFVAFNEQCSGGCNYAQDFYAGYLAHRIANVTTWPTTTSDGFWTNTDPRDYNGRNAGFGSYSRPFISLAAAHAAVSDGSKLRMRPGTFALTAPLVLSKKVLLDAPLGPAVVGD